MSKPTWRESWTQNAKGMILLRRGEVEAAARMFDESERLTQERPDWIERLNTLSQRALIELGRGEPEAARALAREALGMIAEKPPVAAHALDGLSGTMEAFVGLWAGGSAPVADRLAAQQTLRALQRFSQLFAMAESRAWYWQGHLERMLGHAGKATRAWQRSQQLAERLDMAFDAGKAAAALAGAR